jgi:hypothetical protein
VRVGHDLNSHSVIAGRGYSQALSSQEFERLGNKLGVELKDRSVA